MKRVREMEILRETKRKHGKTETQRSSDTEKQRHRDNVRDREMSGDISAKT